MRPSLTCERRCLCFYLVGMLVIGIRYRHRIHRAWRGWVALLRLCLCSTACWTQTPNQPPQGTGKDSCRHPSARLRLQCTSGRSAGLRQGDRRHNEQSRVVRDWQRRSGSLLPPRSGLRDCTRQRKRLHNRRRRQIYSIRCVRARKPTCRHLHVGVDEPRRDMDNRSAPKEAMGGGMPTMRMRCSAVAGRCTLAATSVADGSNRDLDHLRYRARDLTRPLQRRRCRSTVPWIQP